MRSTLSQTSWNHFFAHWIKSPSWLSWLCTRLQVKRHLQNTSTGLVATNWCPSLFLLDSGKHSNLKALLEVFAHLWCGSSLPQRAVVLMEGMIGLKGHFPCYLHHTSLWMDSHNLIHLTYTCSITLHTSLVPRPSPSFPVSQDSAWEQG